MVGELLGWQLGTCVQITQSHQRRRLRGWTGRIFRWIEEEQAYLVGLDLSNKVLLISPEDLVRAHPGTKPHRPLRRRRRGTGARS